MIKAVLFDYGGVITAGGAAGTGMSDKFAAALGVAPEKGWLILKAGWADYISGRIDEAEFWRFAEKEYGQEIPDAIRKNVWNTWDIMQPLPQMAAYVQELKYRGLTVGLLSNVFAATAKEIREHGGYGGFDFVVLSAEVGYGKPEPEIYQLALAKLPGIKPEEIIFVDDQERCLVPARELGMQTVLAVTPDQITQEVNALIATAHN